MQIISDKEIPQVPEHVWLNRSDETRFTFSIAPDVVRFYPPDESTKQVIQQFEHTSFAINPPRAASGPVPKTYAHVPKFYTIIGGTLARDPITGVPKEADLKPDILSLNAVEDNTRSVYGARIDTPAGTSFYGGGETASPLNITGKTIVTWNKDAYRYDENFRSLYQTMPYVMAVTPDGSAFGMLADTTFPIAILCTESGIVVESRADPSQPFSIVIINRPHPREVIMTLAQLTGYMALPPKWSIGYHQCRWSYYPDSKAREIADQMRHHKMPCDVIWFDIHYMDSYKIFTFNPHTFPEPKELNDYLHQLGYHTVWMIDPGVKYEKGYFVHDQCVEQNLAVLKENGEIYLGDVWPGPCVFPDFTMEETREWWGTLYKDFMAQGVDGVWNDMNEPSVFNEPTGTMPPHNQHRGCGAGDHLQFHNVYGMQMVKASRAGILKANPDKRPFILSRSNFIGGHRYAATWTGDNTSSWRHLYISMPMIMNLAICGQPFSGPDVGGFFDDASDDLFARWMGIGAMFPFSRAHTHEETKPHEPYAFSEHVTDSCRLALYRRYKLLPYYYTCFYHASINGLPVMGPIFMVDPKDPDLRSEDRAFMIGDNLLVVANVLEPGVTDTRPPVALPKNVKWYDLDLDGETKVDKKDLPQLKIRAGTIIPSMPEQQYIGEKPLTEITLLVALDDNHSATGVWYEDSGDGYEYQTGDYKLVTFKASQAEGTLNLEISSEGNYVLPKLALKLEVHSGDQVHKHQVAFKENTNISVVLPS